MAVPLVARDGERYVAHVLPLSSGARRSAGVGYAAAAVLFVQKAALATRSPPEAIAKTYRLTAMEVRVLLAIVEIGGVPDVAETLGIGESTVKTHLKRLYEKTGARTAGGSGQALCRLHQSAAGLITTSRRGLASHSRHTNLGVPDRGTRRACMWRYP